jgi:carboxylesterase type B
MIWWYGGALQGGSVSGFDGSSLAANGDVVVLASNYRVGVFGFPGNVSGIPADELNAGFRDQKRALQWIQDNIASFGGDKNRVTIFGDSAGAVSVDSQLLSEPFDKPLFHSAILHSGGLHTFNRIALDIGPYSTGLGTGNKKDEAPFLTLAKALECPVEQALQCVQSKTVTEVKAGVSKVNLLFPPVDDDGLSSVDDSDSARRAGRMVKVPSMVGSTFSEGDIFPENLISSKSVEEWVKIIYPRSESNRKAVLDAYAVGTSYMIQTTSQARRLLHSDYQFACTSTYDADIMASAGIREFPGPPSGV